MAVAEWTGVVIDWKVGLEDLKRLMAPAFGRSETRASAGAFIDGLLSSTERKTGRMLADQRHSGTIEDPARSALALHRRYSLEILSGSGCSTAIPDTVTGLIEVRLPPRMSRTSPFFKGFRHQPVEAFRLCRLTDPTPGIAPLCRLQWS